MYEDSKHAAAASVSRIPVSNAGARSRRDDVEA
jgi:hypothetical protein